MLGVQAGIFQNVNKKSNHERSNDNTMTKTAFITGITGQDGSYLAELLLEKNYKVHGLIRRSSTFSTERIDHIYSDVHDAGQLRLH